MKIFVLLIAVVGLVSADHHPLSDEFIEQVNRDATTWTAGRNFHRNTPMNYLKGLLGAIKTGKDKLPVLESDGQDLTDLPTEFDARKQWPYCPSISEIRDQSSCGSCWAIASAEVMTDRQCIHKNEHFHYSTEDLISCSPGSGCRGGWPELAMQYWLQKGVVSGGQYNSSEGCQPYELPKCEHHVTGPLPNCKTLKFNTPECSQTCRDGYTKTFNDDKHFAKQVYSVDSYEMDGTVQEIMMMKEIMKNGPVVAVLDVNADLESYKSGVYQHIHGESLGIHAVRILGWGVENGSKYWLVANSWNTAWGDEGYFKILKGNNECGIEGTSIVAGIPK